MVLNFIPGMSVMGAVGQLIVLITQSNKPLWNYNKPVFFVHELFERHCQEFLTQEYPSEKFCSH